MLSRGQTEQRSSNRTLQENGVHNHPDYSAILLRQLRRVRHDQSAHLEPHTQRFRRLKRATGDSIESINSRGTISNSGIVVDPPTVIVYSLSGYPKGTR